MQDAAGNSSTVYAGTIADRQPEFPWWWRHCSDRSRAVLPLSAGAVNGTNASDQAKLTARWKSTSEGAPGQAATGQADRDHGASDDHHLVSPSPVRLLDIIADVRPTRARRPPSVASVRTGSDGCSGGWHSIPRPPPPAALHFAYRSHVDDTIPRLHGCPRIAGACRDRAAHRPARDERRSHDLLHGRFARHADSARAASSSYSRQAQAGNGSSSTQSPPTRRAASALAIASSFPDR